MKQSPSAWGEVDFKLYWGDMRFCLGEDLEFRGWGSEIGTASFGKHLVYLSNNLSLNRSRETSSLAVLADSDVGDLGFLCCGCGS